MNRFTVTTPIFYVNAPPHIGHAYTVVAADVLARFHRQRGEDVFFLTGTDEHGTKVAEAAAAAGKEPQSFADKISATFRSAWEVLDVQYDAFIRTTEPRHVQGVRHALHVLHERGHLYEKSYRGLYCAGCEKFLTEKDLDVTGKCPLHNRKPKEVEEKNWFFKLSSFLDEVRARIERDELTIAPAERKNEVRGLFAQGIEDFSISRPKERVPWAIPLPFDESQTCYVWVDALLNYVTALGYGPESEKRKVKNDKLARYWPADLHIVGQDILKFHAVYWPALLLSLGLALPKEVFVHGFFTVNGQKISKSLGNAVDPAALVARYGADATRYLLLSQFPFGTSGDVDVARFDERYHAVLANTVGNLVSRTIALVQKFSGGAVPALPRDHHAPAADARAEFWGRQESRQGTPAEVGATLDDIVRAPVDLAIALNGYVDRAAPWKEPSAERRDASLRALVEGVAIIGILAEPVLPATAAAIRRAFGVRDGALPEPGSPISPTDPARLFPRIEHPARSA